MKRILSVVLALMLIMSFPASAASSIRDVLNALQDFANENLAENTQPGNGTLSEAIREGKEISLMQQQHKALLAGNIIDISPDGATYILQDPEGGLCLYRNGRFSSISFNQNRGVKDEYGLIDQIIRDFSMGRISAEGFTWSPDGRMAVYTNNYNLLITLQFVYDLLILDVEKGEFFLGATWPRMINKGGASVAGACFDAAGENIYYSLYGKNDTTPTSLYRYNIASGENERLTGNDGVAYGTGMFMTKDGKILGLNESMSSVPSVSMLEYFENNGSWKCTPHTIGTEEKRLSVHNMMFSADKERGVMWARILTGKFDMAYWMLAFDMKAGSPDRIEAIMIPNHENQAVRMSISEAYEQLEKAAEENVYPLPYCNILNVALSPNGEHALILYREDGLYYKMALIDTETLSVTPVNAPEAVLNDAAGYQNALNIGFPAGIRWFTENEVVICTDKKPVLYTLRW